MLLKARSGAMRHEPVAQLGHSRMTLASSRRSSSHGIPQDRTGGVSPVESRIGRQQASCLYQTFCQQCDMRSRTGGNQFQISLHNKLAAQNSKQIGIRDGELVPGQISRILQLSGDQRDSDGQGFTCHMAR
jgi:hypothetical protein